MLLISAGSNGGNAVNAIDFDVASVTLWSCDAYQTSQCNGTTLQTQTLPTGQTESYYHP